MKKKNETLYKEVLNAFVGKETKTAAEAKAKAETQEEAREATPKKERFLQKYEQTGEALQETLSEETKELIKLRRGRPKMKTLQEEGVYIRTSFVLRALYIEKLREVAFRENITLKEVVEEAFKNAIEAYERKNGALTISNKKGSAKGLFSE